MDNNEFFRQAAMRICRNLEIEESLKECLEFLREVMPLDRIFIQTFDSGYGAMRTIATASTAECRKMNLLTPLSKEARISAQREDFPKSQSVFIFDNPDNYAISRELLAFHKVQCTSLMVMLLNSNDQILGSLVLISEGKENYSERHAELLELLKEPFIIATSNTLEHMKVQKLKDLLIDDNQYLHGELRRLSGDEIIGANFGLKEVMTKVRQVSKLDSPVLLLGETGAGKDVIANAIHYSSERKGGPFVNVNCGAIPETLIDSELFGHEKGAFTGALSQKRGRFERANNGTIFLDEIGELPLQAQVRLLRVLQNKEIERVGGLKTIKLDIRVIAATNRNLQEMVEEKTFREDLWFRLNVFPIQIPSLRQRKSDIPSLLQHFISLKAKELKLTEIPILKKEAIDPLLEYDWPGNVRELQNIVERELILNPKGPISFDNIKSSTSKTEIPQTSDIMTKITSLDEHTTQYIETILEMTNGKINGVGGAAELLGINANTLRNKMNKLGIKYGKKRN